ncbi:MAG: hypothetical protein HC893_13720 [Chloroflexaceae bacterium]|nr:hypothetical protein [Chloroflexaceae bacterium]
MDCDGDLYDILEVPDAFSEVRFFYATFSPDGEEIAATGTTSTVWIWSLDGELLEALEISDPEERGTSGLSIAYSPDGRLIAASAEDGAAYVWEVDSGALVATLTGHTQRVTRVVFSPDGQQLLTGGDDTARLWSLDGTQLAVVNHGARVESVAFSPDGQLMLTAGETLRHVWAVADSAGRHSPASCINVYSCTKCRRVASCLPPRRQAHRGSGRQTGCAPAFA